MQLRKKLAKLITQNTI